MPATNRDRDIVEHILRYCRQVEIAHQDFGCSKERFTESSTYQDDPHHQVLRRVGLISAEQSIAGKM